MSDNNKMTVQKIKEIVKDGGSVVWNGDVICREDQIPTEAEFALKSVNSTKEDLVSTLQGLETEIARLQNEANQIKEALKEDKPVEAAKSPESEVEIKETPKPAVEDDKAKTDKKNK